MVWNEVKIGDLGRVVTGRTPPTTKPELFGQVYPFITPTDIDGQERQVIAARYISEAGRSHMERILLPTRAIAYVCIASVGKVCVVDRPSFTNQQINSVVVDETRFDAHFIYYALREATPRIKSTAGGAATPIINKSAFSNIALRIPPFSTQRHIATILSTYDDLIENNTRRIAILEEMSRRIYEEWFVRFRFPGYEQVRILESELGLIPEGWQIGQLRDIVRLLSGYAFKTQDFVEGGDLGLVTIKNVQDGEFVSECSSRLAAIPAKMPPHCRLTTGDVLLSLTGNVGRCCTVIGTDYLLNQRVSKLQSIDRSDVPFVYCIFRSADTRKKLESISNGVAQQNLSPIETEKMPWVIPPLALRRTFSDLVAPQQQLARNLRLKNANLRTTRDLLLPKLISGELDVSHLPEPEAMAA